MADMFNSEPSDQTPSVTFNDLVGEQQKYKDPDDLAKAYANVESFAEQLKRENAELRAAKDLRDAELNNQKTPEQIEQEQAALRDQERQPPKTSSTPEKIDFRSQIREEIKALTEGERAEENLNATATRMAELYGSEDGAKEAIGKRSRELGVSVDWLRDSASKSPTAFFATMGITAPESRSTPAPNSEVRLQGNTNVKDFEYFDKLRKDNPKLYFSAATQKDMMAEAKRQGGGFYRT